MRRPDLNTSIVPYSVNKRLLDALVPVNNCKALSIRRRRSCRSYRCRLHYS